MARLIKRYENRKMYDTEASGYVSLADIAGLVRQGETVQIIDNVSGDDLTAQVLTQIILEEGKRGTNVIPTDLLHDLLRRSSEAVDTGLDRIRHGVDDLLQNSLGRLGKLVQDSRATELHQLRTQMSHLEGMLNRLLDDVEQREATEEKASK